ncbi:hypothetical protein KP509_09G052900 [Ceratopteris richardii]|nr:hypothetical protein KP509_09G052900 [Ceratopteris richardii]
MLNIGERHEHAIQEEGEKQRRSLSAYGEDIRHSAGGALKEALRVLAGWCLALLDINEHVDRCTIVNETDKDVLVRAKYRNVWEGDFWHLSAAGGEMVVPPRFLPENGEPYNRLGAFLLQEPLFSTTPLLLSPADLSSRRLVLRILVPVCVTSPHLLPIKAS